MSAPAPSPSVDHFPLKTSHLDIWVVALIGMGGAAMLMGNFAILCNRTYTPIRSKSVPLTLLSSLGGLMWIIAVLVANDHFERKEGSGLNVCILWTYWLQVCGFALWLNCLTLRLIGLYRIFICKRGTRNFYPLLIPLLLPAIAFCIAASSTHELKYERNRAPLASRGDEAKADCKFQNNAYMAYGVIALLVFSFFLFLGLAFRLRNALAQFNEFRLIRRGGILSLFLFLLSLVTIQTHAYYRPVGRCLLSAAVASAIFYYFWARNGVVIYNVLFNRQDYLEKFNNDFMRPLSQHERQMSSSAGFLQMQAQLRDARAEVQEHQDKIRQLEEEVKTLEFEYAAMQQAASSNSSPNGRDSISKDFC